MYRKRTNGVRFTPTYPVATEKEVFEEENPLGCDRADRGRVNVTVWQGGNAACGTAQQMARQARCH